MYLASKNIYWTDLRHLLAQEVDMWDSEELAQYLRVFPIAIYMDDVT